MVPGAGAESDAPRDAPVTASTDREYTTRRLLRHYGNYASAAAKCARPRVGREWHPIARIKPQQFPRSGIASRRWAS